MLNALPFWLRILLIVVVMLHVLLLWRRYFRDHSKVKLLYSQSKGWVFEDKAGVNTIQILPSTVITTFVIILHFKIRSGEKQSIIILKDALLIDAFREVTVALKLYGLN